MNYKILITSLLFAAVLYGCSTSANQPDASKPKLLNEYWTELPSLPKATYRKVYPTKYRALKLDIAQLRAVLSSQTQGKMATVLLPLPDGSNPVFQVKLAPVSTRNNPNQDLSIRNYTGRGTEANSIVRVKLSTLGLNVQMNTATEQIIIEPLEPGDTLHYLSYFKSALPAANNNLHNTAPPAEK